MTQEPQGDGSSSWLGFIAGLVLLAVVAIGVVAFSGGFNRQDTSEAPIEQKADADVLLTDRNEDGNYIEH